MTGLASPVRLLVVTQSTWETTVAPPPPLRMRSCSTCSKSPVSTPSSPFADGDGDDDDGRKSNTTAWGLRLHIFLPNNNNKMDETAKRARVVEEEEEDPAAVMAGAVAVAAPISGVEEEMKPSKEFEVPLVAINKILKAALPDGANCTKDAKTAFSKAAGIFILYITACANELAKTGKRSTINSQDVMTALTELGYASFIPHLESTLEKMRVESIARKVHKLKPKKGQAQGGGEDDEDDGAGATATTTAATAAGGSPDAEGATGGGEPLVGALAML
ncbi:hypothetical protein BASA81_010776 [Batrachochytrium salamandrivorans]|nr:hypothetical protein BASA81_010776 [Batrachochytrium salamandrivorans]